ncbi:pentapeptide repeat-containing protein [Leptolyngbya cf. ectocarpi LEGE 11479]|uniref:Pentapeptide repeat-containing protein n=1 Tax=Leptolyngbya cf. ectocarpi LEGE 11479 TaxID=1828722 RepID=A0A929A0T5_LEPEC|nr:pentapeptide repeat-containing protein [Leptolyngbya ectocarpi]MBE9070916.1 pentapeptide repeat-containing protein [Leptolyngbya cf. ectocarpi LEGE 11479]
MTRPSEDKALVIALYERLKQKGYQPWLDQKDLLPGQQWREEIPKAIKNSDIFVACLSHQSVAKQGYIQREFRMALNQCADKPPGTIYLIPLKLDQCKIPELRQDEYGINLTDYQWIDYFEKDGFERLEQAIQHQFYNLIANCSPSSLNESTTSQEKKGFESPIQSASTTTDKNTHDQVTNSSPSQQEELHPFENSSSQKYYDIAPLEFIEFFAESISDLIQLGVRIFTSKFLWLILLALFLLSLIVDLIEGQIREQRIKRYLSHQSDSSSSAKNEKEIQKLKIGCLKQKTFFPLSEYIFGNCHLLDNITFEKAELRHINLSHVVLSGINFRDADLRDASLDYANLSNTDLSNADLRDASLNYANLSDVQFENAHLSRTELVLANLYQANFRNADLDDADFQDADLRFTDFSNATLRSANFDGVNLSDASFFKTNISQATFLGADFSSSIFLHIDFRKSTAISPRMFDSSILCNVVFPNRPDFTKVSIDSNRDCALLPQILSSRHEISLEEAQKIVNEARQSVWE